MCRFVAYFTRTDWHKSDIFSGFICLRRQLFHLLFHNVVLDSWLGISFSHWVLVNEIVKYQLIFYLPQTQTLNILEILYLNLLDCFLYLHGFLPIISSISRQSKMFIICIVFLIWLLLYWFTFTTSFVRYHKE